MKTEAAFERCKAFIDCHLKSSGRATRLGAQLGQRPFVTVSGQAGAGSLLVAAQLSEVLQQRLPGPDCAWTVFEKNLVEKVLEDHHLPKSLAHFMPEAHVSSIADTMEQLFDLHPSTWTLVQHTAQTVLHLAQLGYVILVDRATNIITKRCAAGLHVHLVGSRECRLRRVGECLGLEQKAAEEFADETDRGRRRYMKDHFHQDIEDSLLYDLTLNTDRLSIAEAVQTVADLMVARHGSSVAPPG